MAQLPPQQEMAEEVEPLKEGRISDSTPDRSDPKDHDQSQVPPCETLNLANGTNEKMLQDGTLEGVIQIEEVKITLDNRQEGDNKDPLSPDHAQTSVLIVTKEQIESEDKQKINKEKEDITHQQSFTELEGEISSDPAISAKSHPEELKMEDILEESCSSPLIDTIDLQNEPTKAKNLPEMSIAEHRTTKEGETTKYSDPINPATITQASDMSKDSEETLQSQRDSKEVEDKIGEVSSDQNFPGDSIMARMDEKFGMKEVDVETLVKKSLPLTPENNAEKLVIAEKEDKLEVLLEESIHLKEETLAENEIRETVKSTEEKSTKAEGETTGSHCERSTPEKTTAIHIKSYSPRSTPPSTPSKRPLKKDGMTATEKADKGPKKSGPMGASRTASTSPKKSTMKNGLASPAKTPTSSETKKLPPIKAPVGLAPSPNVKEVKSKIGSMANIKHKPKGGEKKVVTQKLEWNTSSKIGSFENATHKAGGGEKKIVSQKLNFKGKAQSKIGSLDNATHKPGGGNVKIEDQKLAFKEKAQSRVGSMDNVKHKPGGGEVKIRNEKLCFKEKAQSKIGSITSSEKGSTHGSETQSTGNASPPPDMPPVAENGEFKV